MRAHLQVKRESGCAATGAGAASSLEERNLRMERSACTPCMRQG